MSETRDHDVAALPRADKGPASAQGQGSKYLFRKSYACNAVALLLAGAMVAGTVPMQALAVDSASSSGDGQATMQAPPDSKGEAPSDAPEPSNGSASGDKPAAPPDGAQSGQNGSGGPGGGGADTQKFDYTGTYSGVSTADSTSESASDCTLAADQSDQNVALAQNGRTLALSSAKLVKSGDDTDGDRCNFYGANSIALAVGENSLVKLSSCSLTASSAGSNAVFATNNATAFVHDCKLKTSADNLRGLDATYGGTVVADSVDIATKGDHCAGIATDRGGGSISCTNSNIKTSGSGSPLLYSTGNIEVNKVKGSASGSQLVGMEGYNTVRISNSTLKSTLTSKTASDPMADGIIIYQSMSGDADTAAGETARLTASDSTLESSIKSGSMFYVTNTTAQVLLSNTKLKFDSSKAKLLTVQGNNSNGWGTAGSNGATVAFTGIGQALKGDIEVDSISSADVYLLQGSTYTGATQLVDNADGGEAIETPLTMNVSSDSTWVVTGDSVVSKLNVQDGGKVVDEQGKSVSIAVSGQTVVKGESKLTVTVNGAYDSSFETGDANQVSGATIDRSAFDTEYGTTTSFDYDANAAAASSGAAQDGGEAGIVAWWKSFLRSLGF